MGNEVNVEFIKAMQIIADRKFGNGDKELKAEEKDAIRFFEEKMEEAFLDKKTINAETFNHAMGLYKANATGETKTVEADETEKLTKKEKKAAKKALEVKQDNIKTDIDALIKGDKDARLGQDTSISLNNLVDKLTAKNPADHATVIADVQEVIAFVQTTGFNSKEDVKNLEKKIEKNKDFNDFQKDLAKNMVELAKREQINKEAEVLANIYYDIKKDTKNPENFSNYLKLVETEMENRGLRDTSYYSKEAFKALETIVREDAANKASQERVQMIAEGSDNTTSKKVRKELINEADKKDKAYKAVVKDQKDENALTARWLDKDRRAEELEKISEKDLKKELGDELFNVLRKYLESHVNADGTYNVRDLSDKLFERVGYDVWMNMSDDTEMSELHGAKNELKVLTGRDFSDKDIKKIMKLVHIPKEPKDRNFMRALKESIVPGIAGAIAGASAYQSLEVTQRVQLNMDSATATEMISQLKAAGISPSITQGQDGTITVTILQKVLQDYRALMALGGAGLGVLTSTLMNLILGMENKEKSCISIADFDLTNERYTDVNNYKNYIKEIHPEAKANLIIALVDTFHAKYGDDWAKEYDAMLKQFAGRGSVLNCLELRGGKLIGVKKVEEVQEPEVKTTVITQGKKDAVDPQKVKVDMPEDKDYNNSSWEKLSTQYECLDKILDTIPDAKTKYPNCYKKREVLAEKILKAAQAVTDVNVLNDVEKMLYIAEEAFKSPDYKYETLKNCEFIDHAKFSATMKAEWLGKVRMPESLAGCQRVIKDTKDNKYDPKIKVTKAPVNPADVYTTTKGEDAKFGYRINNGPVQPCKDQQDLDKKVAEAQREAQARGEKVTIEKIKPYDEFAK